MLSVMAMPHPTAARGGFVFAAPFASRAVRQYGQEHQRPAALRSARRFFGMMLALSLRRRRLLRLTT